MMEKSCGWWLIWYLLFFCYGGAEVQLQWVVKEKVTAYGQNLILFCPVENCCSEPAGWSVGNKSIIIDVKTFSNDPKVKYHGTYTKDGFGVVIRNLSEADLNVFYRCAYGFNQSTPKHLLHGDVFRENVPDKDKENYTAAIVVPIVVIMVGFIIGIGYCVYRSQIKKKRQKEKGTDEEMEDLNASDSQMQNQQDNSLSKEENHFLRLYLLCHQTGTQAVRALFDKTVPQLDSFLKQNKSNLIYIRNDYKCTKEEEAKLFPGGQVAVDSADLDFPLLYKLLRNLVRAIPAPSRGWGIPPLPMHLNTADDIERIRHLRTSLAHNSKVEISEADCFILWTDLSEAINRLRKYTLSIDVKSMGMKSFDRCIKNEMEEDVRKVDNKMREDFMEQKQQAADNTQEIHNISTRVIPSSIQNIPLSKEVNHFLRLYLLCHKTGTQVVRDFFDSNVPDLNSFLKQHKSSDKCTREQKALMFPGGQIADNSADFDFTLLYKLIRNFLTTIPAPACGWGNQPFPGNLNEADDIERIRHLKNSLTHNSKFEICDTDFSTLWNDLSKVIERLSNSNLLRNVESMRMKSFDKGQQNEMEEDIRKQVADNTRDPQH